MPAWVIGFLIGMGIGFVHREIRIHHHHQPPHVQVAALNQKMEGQTNGIKSN